MKQKVKSTKAKEKSETFQDCQEKWDKEEDTKENLTTPISVIEHYKKYTIEERKFVWQKLNQEKPIAGISYEGPKDVKKVDLANPREDAKPLYIATNLESTKEQELIKILQD